MTTNTARRYVNPINKVRHEVCFPPIILLINAKPLVKTSQYSNSPTTLKAKDVANQPLNVVVARKLVRMLLTARSIFVALAYNVAAITTTVSAEIDISPFALGF